MTRQLVRQLAVLLVALFAGQAQSKRIKPRAESLLVRCKLLINPVSGAVLENAAIQVANGKIMRVGTAAELGTPSVIAWSTFPISM
jgi:hypothetical protein